MEKRDPISRDQAAKNLLVKINDIPYKVNKIAIVRRQRRREHWVYLDVTEPRSGLELKFLIERKGMIASWLALDMGQKKFNHLQIEVNGEPWKAQDVFKEKKNEAVWITLCVSNPKTNLKQTISIERQSMVDAYYALRFDIEDIVETGFDLFDELLDTL